MSKLMINDLVESKELDSKAMAGVYGGVIEGIPSSLLNIDTDNLVNETNQTLAQAITFAVPQAVANTNNQALQSRNGAIVAPNFQFGLNAFFGPENFGNATSDSSNSN